MRFTITVSMILATACLTADLRAQDAGSAAKPNSIAIEALSRMKGMDVEGNPALKKAVLKVLDTTRGTADFVKIVQDFQLTGQNPGLLEVAVAHPAEEAGVEAARLILASHDTNFLNQALDNATHSARLVEALGNTREKELVPLLTPVLSDDKRDATTRKQAVRALAQVQDGANALLQLAQEDKLAADLKFTATTELNQVRWPELKAKAAQILPMPQGKNTEALPPVAELLKRPGDPKNGREVFSKPAVGCINCHRVNDQGVDLGPALSEIGTKLGKDALYEAILDPSASIAFGFEAWQIELKSGDDAYGIIASETSDEVTLKDTKGIPTHLKKSEIQNRQKSKLSLMPAGLQLTMSTQELVDLVEYLATLKKAVK